VNLEEKEEPTGQEKLTAIIEKSFFTAGGRKLAGEHLLKKQ
jgi:hypothetical protein